MDDFLYNLRSGNQKPYDRSKRGYGTTRHKGSDRYHPKDKRKGYQQVAISHEHFTSLKKLIEAIGVLQKQIANTQDRIAAAEERKACALESLVARLGGTLSEAVDSDRSTTDNTKEPPESVAETEAGKTAKEQTRLDHHKVVELVQTMRKQGVSYVKIAKHLQDKKIPTISGRGIWRGQSVSRLCREED